MGNFLTNLKERVLSQDHDRETTQKMYENIKRKYEKLRAKYKRIKQKRLLSQQANKTKLIDESMENCISRIQTPNGIAKRSRRISTENELSETEEFGFISGFVIRPKQRNEKQDLSIISESSSNIITHSVFD
jgi:intergrase/recombinase